jgi:hypothetical protein
MDLAGKYVVIWLSPEASRPSSAFPCRLTNAP